jgi:hypothetical protein
MTEFFSARNPPLEKNKIDVKGLKPEEAVERVIDALLELADQRDPEKTYNELRVFIPKATVVAHGIRTAMNKCVYLLRLSEECLAYWMIQSQHSSER